MGWLEDWSGAIYTGTDFLLAGALPDFRGPGAAIPAGVSFNQSLVGGIAQVPGQIVGAVVPSVAHPVIDLLPYTGRAAGETVKVVLEPTGEGLGDLLKNILGGAGKGLGEGFNPLLLLGLGLGAFVLLDRKVPNKRRA